MNLCHLSRVCSFKVSVLNQTTNEKKKILQYLITFHIKLHQR